jgi:hypothetical protein
MAVIAGEGFGFLDSIIRSHFFAGKAFVAPSSEHLFERFRKQKHISFYLAGF